MARKWKIVIGVVVAFVVVVCVAALIVGTLSIGGRFHAMGWPSMDRDGTRLFGGAFSAFSPSCGVSSTWRSLPQ
jgi:hypothetical protein